MCKSCPVLFPHWSPPFKVPQECLSVKPDNERSAGVTSLSCYTFLPWNVFHSSRRGCPRGLHQLAFSPFRPTCRSLGAAVALLFIVLGASTGVCVTGSARGCCISSVVAFLLVKTSPTSPRVWYVGPSFRHRVSNLCSIG